MVRRIAIALAVIVLAAVLVLPPVFGARARALLEPRLNAIGDSLAPDILFTVSFDEWEAGWFTSTATVTLQAAFGPESVVAGVAPDAVSAYESTLPKAITLRHGPVIAGDDFGIGWGSAAFVVDAATVPDLEAFHAETGVDEVARLTALVGFLGGTRIALAAAAFETATDSDHVRFDGLDATVTLRDGGNRVRFAGTMRGFSAATPEAPALEAGLLVWDARASRAPGTVNLWLGDGTADLSRILVAGDAASAPTFEMTSARFEIGARIDGERLVGSNRHTARDLRVGTFQLEDLEIDVTATSPLDAARRLAATLDVGGDRDASDWLAAFVDQRITLRVDPLSFRHLDMPLTAMLAVEYPGDLSGDTGTMPDFATLASAVSAELDVSMHKDLLATFGADALIPFVAVLVREGLVAEDGDLYTIEATYQDGELVSNGERVDLGLLLTLLAATQG